MLPLLYGGWGLRPLYALTWCCIIEHTILGKTMNSRTASKTTDQFILAPHPTQISVVKLFQIFLKNGPFSASFFFIFVFSIHWTVNVLYKFLPITADLWNWKRPLYQLNHNHCIFITNIWNHIWPSGWWWRPYAFKVQTSGAGNECSTNWAKVDASVTRYWAISNYENLHNAILWMMKEQNAWNEW